MSEIDTADVRYESGGEDGVAEVVVDRPERRNAMRQETIDGLETALRTAEDDPDVAALVVRSASRDVFSAGADLTFIGEIADDPDACERFFRSLNDLFVAFETSDLAVVACVTGPAMAGGLEVVLACDLAVAGANAEFGDQHINLDLVAGGGASQRLPRLLGPRRAKELVLTGKTVDAETAHRWGLVNEVAPEPADEDDAPALSAARDLAADVAEADPLAIGRSKDLLRTGMDVPLEAGLELERMTTLTHLQSEVVQEALERFS